MRVRARGGGTGVLRRGIIWVNHGERKKAQGKRWYPNDHLEYIISKALLSAVQVGLIATNDSIVLEGCIYRILQRHFRTSPAYGQILELFHEASGLCCWILRTITITCNK